MFTWSKLGRFFDPTSVKGRPWINEFSQAASVLLLDGIIRVFFACRPKPDENGQFVSYLAYVDLDRKNPMNIIGMAERPVLELGALGTFDEFGTNPASVIGIDKDIRVYYCGWSRCESVPFNAALGVAFSKDNGASFQKIGQGPVLSFSPDEPFLLGSPKIRKFNGTWYLFYAVGSKWIKLDQRPEPVYKIRMATSQDGITWKKHGKNLLPSVLEEDECQASPDVLYYGGKYHMFFSYRYSIGYRQGEKGYRIGYASSEDLINWKRDDSKAGLDVSDTGWDSEMVSYAHVFEADENVYMIYQGNQMGRYGLGLAKMNSMIQQP